MKYEEVELRDDVNSKRLEMEVDGHTSFIEYKRSHSNLFLIHTEVPDELEGKGVGSALVEKAFRFADQEGLKIVPLCSFVQSFLKRHTEWQRLVAEDTDKFTAR